MVVRVFECMRAFVVVVIVIVIVFLAEVRVQMVAAVEDLFVAGDANKVIVIQKYY